MSGEMQVDSPQWIISPEDRTKVRLLVPTLPIAGLPKPLNMHLGFDLEALDETISQLTELRVRLRPPKVRH